MCMAVRSEKEDAFFSFPEPFHIHVRLTNCVIYNESRLDW